MVEIPIFSNRTLVINAPEFEKYYKVIENFNYLISDH